jgi:eukaryotic-like serine/threonine-protein kinase
MTPERWQTLKDLFDQALTFEGAEREKFLNERCATDEDLRRELQLLLDSHSRASSFIETPASHLVAGQILDSRQEFGAGQFVGRYEILGSLGAGGMGHVYLAEDSRLKRRVALKVLRSEVADNPERMIRFEQEAKTASALNHPNILTIYEFDQTESVHFIATEFVDGQTLKEYTRATQIPLGKILDLAAQISGALAAAHSAGIVHRDIKPENVMVRRDGIIKVLDFGIAKLVQTSSLGIESETLVQTEPGTIIGTIAYMSPEQLRGLELDARSDIWSLGVVLYEMITGQAPFTGETPSHLGVSILEKEPAPLGQYVTNVSAELQRIVRKTLSKDRDQRYQTTSDLMIDLRNLRKEIDFEGSAFSSESAATLSGRQSTQTPTSQLASQSAYEGRRWTNRILVALVGIMLVALAIISVRWFRPTVTAGAFQKSEITQLTTSRNLRQVAISPDGKNIAYAMTDGENETLWIRQTATANDLQIVSPKNVTHEGITFTRDSGSLYYVTRDRNGVSTLYRISVLGGTSQQLINGVDTPVTFSPDGMSLAFVRGKYPTIDESALLIVDADGSHERILATQHAPQYFYPIGNWTGPSWSPNGELIACAVTDISSRRSGNVYTFAVKTGATQKILPKDFSEVGRVEWLPDMTGLVMVATEKFIGRFPGQIFHVSYPEGSTRRITNDFGDYKGLSITSDASRIVTIGFRDLYGIWVAPERDSSRARQVLPVSPRASISWTPDGRIVYATSTNGRSDVWTMNADGSARQQLTNNAEQNIDPSVSPDGRYVAFYSTRNGWGDVWRIDIDGSHPLGLTNGLLTWQQSWTPDGKYIFFLNYPDWKIWKVPVDGGAPVQVTDRPSFRPTVSPDGKWLACFHARSNAKVSTGTVYDLAILSLDDKSQRKIFPFRGRRLDVTHSILQWSVDGSAIFYNASVDNVGNIWQQPVDGSEPKQITNFKEADISSFAFSRDARTLACARGTLASDALMIGEIK